MIDSQGSMMVARVFKEIRNSVLFGGEDPIYKTVISQSSRVIF
jgi:hypothetical protein